MGAELDLPPGAERVEDAAADLPPGAELVSEPGVEPSADTPTPGGYLSEPMGPDQEPVARAKAGITESTRAFAQTYWPEGGMSDADKLEGILFEAGVGTEGMDQQLAIYRLAKQTGMSPGVVAADYPRLEQAWRAASAQRAIPLAGPGQLPVQQPYKRPGQRFLEEQPDLSKALLRDPTAGFVRKAPEVNSLTKAWRKAADFAFDAPVIGVHTMMPDEVAEEIRKDREKQRAEADQPQFVLQDELSKQMQDGWVDVPVLVGDTLVPVPVPKRAIVPFLRGVESWAGMQKSKAYDELANLETLGRDTQAKEMEILELEQRAIRRDYGEGSVEKVFTDAAEGSVSTAAGFSTVVEQPVETLAVTVPVGLGVALVTKSPGATAAAMLKWGAGYGMWHLERGGAYEQMLNAKKPDGSPAMDRHTARVMSAVYATFAALIETMSWGPMLEAMGPIGAMIQAGEKKAFTEALIKNPGLMGTLKRILKSGGVSGITEGGEELLQDQAQQSAELFGRIHGGRTVGGYQDLVEGFSTRFEGLKAPNMEQSIVAWGAGAAGGMGMAVVSENVNLATQFLARDKAVVDSNKLRELANLAKSPVAANAPQVLADMFEEHTATTGEAVKTVYVTAKEFARVFQDEGADPDSGARSLLGPDGPQRLADAVASGGRLAVPVVDYIEKWVPSEAAKRLLQHTATSELGLTGAEAKALPLDKMAEEIAAKVLGADEQTAATQFDRLEEQIVSSGKATAKEARIWTAPMRALVRTAAASTGVPGAKLFEKYSVTFGAGDEALSVTLGAPADSRYLTRAWLGLKPEQQVRALYIDTTTGALNRRAFDRAKPAGRKFAAISVEGIKYRNDMAGHAAGNVVYRAAAQALAGALEEVYKPGGDFGAFVESEEALQAALERANEHPGLKGFRLTGAVGKSYREAAAENNRRKGELEKSGQRAQRGTRPMQATGELDASVDVLRDTKVNDQLREAASKLDPADMFEETFVDHETGLLNKDGYDAAPTRAFTMSGDLDGVKEMNELFGEEVTDQIISAAGNVMRELEAHQASMAHVSGDEFQGKHDSDTKLKAYGLHVQEQLAGASVDIEIPEAWQQKTGLPAKMALRGLPFSFGVGKTLDDADRALKANKAQRTEEGLRGPGKIRERLVPRAETAAAAARPGTAEGDRGAAAGDAGAVQLGGRPLQGADFGRQRFFDVGRLEQAPAAPVAPKPSRVSTVGLFTGKETLEKYGLPAVKLDKTTGRPLPGSPHGKGRYGLNLVRDIYIALEKRALEMLGGEPIAPDDFEPAAREKLARGLADVVHAQLATDPATSGEGWYGDMFKTEALGNAAKIFPELEKDRAKRGIFTAILAITSGDQKVIQNFNSSLPILETYLKHKRMPRTEAELKIGLGKNGNAALGLLGRVQTLIDKLGEQGAIDFLLKEDTVGNMKELVKKLKLDVSLKGFNDDERVPMAAVYLSPKFGTFWSNLMGADGYLTMDLWWSRMINTMRGNVVTVPKRVAIDNFKKQMANQKLFAGQMKQGDKAKLVRSLPAAKHITDAQAFKEAERLEEIVRGEKNYGKAWKQKSKEHLPVVLPTAYERSGNELYKQRYEKLNQAPFNPSDRGFQLGVARRAQEHLQAELKRPISIADIQALSWFYEQRLVESLGGENDSDTTYGEAAAANVKARAEGRTQATAADVAAVRPVLAAARRKRRAAREARRARQDAEAAKGSARRTRLEQFPTPEESDEALKREVVLLDLIQEKGTVVSTQQAMVEGVKAQLELLPKSLQEKLINGTSKPDGTPVALFWTYEQTAGRGQTKYFNTLEQAEAYALEHPVRLAPGAFRTGRPGAPGSTVDASPRYQGVTSLNVNWPAVSSSTYGIYNELTTEEREGFQALNRLHSRVLGENDQQARALGVRVLTHEAYSGEDALSDERGEVLGDKRRGKGPPKSKDLPGQAALELHQAGVVKFFRLEQFERVEAPTDKGTPRGYTDVLREGMETIFRVALNPNSDVSTFHHETGHVFLELLSDLSDLGGKEAQRYKSMFADTLAWLKVDEADWAATPREQRIDKFREQHEKFARGYEAYLFEGKAPSASLRKAFARMKLWVRSVYRDIRNLNVELNDSIRSVYDRLLATDDELNRQARRQGTLSPMAQDLMGMTDAEYLAYSDAEHERLEAGSLRADLQAIKDELREHESWWKEEHKKELSQARERYEELRARRVQVYLRGKSADAATSVALDRRQVERAVGPELARKFQLRKNGGENIDDIATGFDYPTGKAMLEDVLALPEKAKWAKAEAVEAMAEKHPGVLEDRARLAELIGQGLHGEMTQKWLMQEWVALKRKVTPPGQSMWTAESAPIETLKLAARKIVERTRLGALNPGAVLAAERKAADLALKHAAKGEYGVAFLNKQEQLLNMFRWRYITEARQAREKFLELSGRLAKDVDPSGKESRLGKASPVYRDFTAALLEALGLKEPGAQGADVPSIGDLVDQLDTDAMTVGFDEQAIDHIMLAQGQTYKDLTVAQLHHVDALLRTVHAAATGKNSALYGEKRMDLEELEQKLISDSEAHGAPPQPPMPSSISGRNRWQGFRGWIVSLDGSLLRPEQMIRMFMGASWVKALVAPLQKAKQRELALLKEVVKPVVDAMEAIPRSVRNRMDESIDGKKLFPNHKVAFDANILAPTKRHELLVMALNMGNESNIQRLTLGRGITLEEMNAALKLLTKEELDWVQSVWDASEKMWPLAAELEERDSGLAPERLERRPLVTKHGTYAGGYFPAVYDWRVEQAGERQQANTLAGIIDPRHVRPATAQSHLKGRVDGFSGCIALEAATVKRALFQAAHDIAYREAVKSVGTLLLRPALRAEMNNRMGVERAEQMLQWLKDVSQMRGLEGAVKTDAIIKVMRHLRAGKVVEVLGYSMTTALGDLANFATAIPRSGLKLQHWGSAMLEYATSPREAMAKALAMSGELQTRRTGLLRKLEHQVRDLSKSGYWALRGMRWITDNAFAFLEATDAITSAPVWMGGYRQALAEGKSEKEAVDFADSMIRDNFPGESAVDLPAVLRDKAWVGQSLMFYRYFSVVYNSLREMTHPLATAEDPLEFARRVPRAAGRVLAFGTIALVLSELLSGRGPDDDEDWASWYARKLFFGGLSSVPLAGEAGAAIEQLVLGKRSNPRGNVLVGLFSDMAKGIVTLKSDDADADKKVKAVMQMIAPVLHLPASQPLRTGLGAAGQFGDDPGRNPLEVGSDVVYGRRKGQPKNLLSIAGEAAAGSPR